MAFRSDNAFESELVRMLRFLELLKKEINQLMSTHKTLPIKDKVLLIQKIQRDFKYIQAFIYTAKKEKNLNTAINFKLDNVKSKALSLSNLWRKVEEKL